MPGPGPHLMYAMGSGLAFTHLSNGRFTSHHNLVYTLNAFFGPDIGSFSDWLADTFFPSLESALPGAIHHPFYYVFILGLPLTFFYSWASRALLHRGLLHSFSGVPLSKRQCILLISAGSISHFFLDHLFEEDGHSAMYTWILSTGWWINRAPINPDAVLVVGFLCTLLMLGFICINRGSCLGRGGGASPSPSRSSNISCSSSSSSSSSSRSSPSSSYESFKLVMVVASLYCLWCSSQIYWVNPRRAAVGEEADLGVIVFMAIYFFLPHCLCILSTTTTNNHPAAASGQDHHHQFHASK